MSATLALTDHRALDDLATLVGRLSGHVEPAVRLQGFGQVMLATLAVIGPESLLDATPTVLVCRAFRSREEYYDAVVPIDAVRDALRAAQSDGATITLPGSVGIVPSWAAQSPPRAGWQREGERAVEDVRAAATDALARIAAALPAGIGELRARPIRRDVLGTVLPVHDLLAGAAFAAHTAGFLTPSAVGDGASIPVFRQGRWQRFVFAAGDVIVKDG